MSKKPVWFGAALALLIGMVFLTGTATATEPTNMCGESGVIGANGSLRLKKVVFCERDTSWTWIIRKVVDQASLDLSLGQSHVVNYEVTTTATESSTYRVNGRIHIMNTSSVPVMIASLTDTLGDVTCEDVTFPFELAAGTNKVCTYEGTLTDAAPQNTATVTTVNGVSLTAIANITWTLAKVTEMDECVAVTDTFAGNLGTVCANGQTTFTFPYSRTIGPYDVCGDYTVDNTASFLTNDSGAAGSDSETVNVHIRCAGSCTLTPGYWKTHSIFGPAPYDDTWAMIGENTPFFSSNQTYYQVLWTSPGGNAYYILAHAYIAAKLNLLNGADLSAVQSAFDAATALFSNPANTPAAVGALRGSAKAGWTNLATTLDNFNNGLTGPGHCSE